ncbi:MAG: NAD(P)H-dependent oxidoreductase subunit E [Chloroflexota bacterium]|nr:NAD(P)H-dependent oxidoreductase subunit E [Chloroflexota bacterium]
MNVTPAEELVAELQPENREKIDVILAKNLGKPGATMLVLTLVQEEVGYISPPMQSYLAEQLHVPLSHLYGVLTFYSSFRTSPIGRHKVSVCLGTACYVRDGPMLVEKLKQLLEVDINETTEDNRFTLEICRCVGACSQAPVVMVDDDIVGRVDPGKIGRILRKYK